MSTYFRHSDEMIQRLEQAGLGYRVRAHETKDKLGERIMSQLHFSQANYTISQGFIWSAALRQCRAQLS